MCYIQGAHSILSSFKGGNAMRKKKKSSFESSIHVYRAMARMTQQDLAIESVSLDKQLFNWNETSTILHYFLRMTSRTSLA